MSIGLIASSSLTRKYLMAISGVFLFLFVIGHMLGNLQVFLGPESLNAYGAFLKSKPGLLWTVRLILLVIVVFHIVTGIQLALQNRRARPVRYANSKPPYANLASRTVLISGLVIFSFVAYHLMQFTLGVTNPEYLHLEDSKGRHDVYRMAVEGFSSPGVTFFYILAMGLLCLHLSHGVSSAFQSLGLKNKRTEDWICRLSQVSAIVIFVGNSSMPLAVLLGYVK
jgi:succinate dehydrogenase / fumarate reductase cytochrome b subunit